MKCICDSNLKFTQRTCFRWKHNRFNLTPYKVAQWGHKRRTRWSSNWFSSTSPLVCEEVTHWPSHIRSILQGVTSCRKKVLSDLTVVVQDWKNLAKLHGDSYLWLLLPWKRKYWYHVTSCGRTRYVIWGSLFHVAIIIELFPSQRRPLTWPLMWKVTSSENVSCSRNAWDWVVFYLICWQKSDVAW